MADADEDYSLALADAFQKIDISGVEEGYELRVSAADAVYNTAVTDTQNARRTAVAAALGDYEVTLYTDHELALEAIAGVTGEPLDQYRADVAEAERVWAEAVRDARNLYHHDPSGNFTHLEQVYAAQTFDLNLALLLHANAKASTASTYDAAIASANTSLAKDLGEADADLTEKISIAAAQQAKADVAAEVEYDNEVAKAQRDLNDKLAGHQVTWVTQTADAKADLYIADLHQRSGGPLTDPDLYNGNAPFIPFDPGFTPDVEDWDAFYTARDAAQDTLDQARQTELLAHADTLGAAQIQRANALGDAAITYAETLGDAGIEYASDRYWSEITHATLVTFAETQRAQDDADDAEAYAADLAQTDVDFITALGTADVEHRQLLGAAHVDRAEAAAQTEADYHRDVTAAEATRIANWAGFDGTPRADFQLAEANAFADWVEDVGPDYVAFVKAAAEADADYQNRLAEHAAARRVQDAEHDQSYSADLQPHAKTQATAIVAADREYFDGVVERESTQRDAAAEAEKSYARKLAGAEKEHAADIAEAHKQHQIDVLNGVSGADEQLSAALEAADEKQKDALAGATRDWIVEMAAADKMFVSTEATADRVRQESLADADKQYGQDTAVERAEYDTDIAQSQTDYWDAVVTSRNTWRTDQSIALADFRTARFDDLVVAMTAFSTELGTDWAAFQADLSTARRDWWAGVKQDFLDDTTAVNQAHTAYQTTVSQKYREQVAAQTQADITRTIESTAADAKLLSDIAQADEAYLIATAAQTETYLITTSTADRDLELETIDQSAHDAQHLLAKTTYTVSQVASRVTRRLAKSAAQDEFTDANGPSYKTWVKDTQAATKQYASEEAQADTVRDAAISSRDEAQQAHLAESYQEQVGDLADLNDTPWADYHAEIAVAQSDMTDATAEASKDLEIKTSEASRDQSISIAEAWEAVANAGASALSAYGVLASAAVSAWTSTTNAADEALTAFRDSDYPALSAPQSTAPDATDAAPVEDYASREDGTYAEAVDNIFAGLGAADESNLPDLPAKQAHSVPSLRSSYYDLLHGDYSWSWYSPPPDTPTPLDLKLSADEQLRHGSEFAADDLREGLAYLNGSELDIDNAEHTARVKGAVHAILNGNFRQALDLTGFLETKLWKSTRKAIDGAVDTAFTLRDTLASAVWGAYDKLFKTPADVSPARNADQVITETNPISGEFVIFVVPNVGEETNSTGATAPSGRIIPAAASGVGFINAIIDSFNWRSENRERRAQELEFRREVRLSYEVAMHQRRKPGEIPLPSILVKSETNPQAKLGEQFLEFTTGLSHNEAKLGLIKATIRATGREVIRSDEWFLNNPDTWVFDFLVRGLSDPLTYAGLGFGVASKTMQLRHVRHIGHLDDVYFAGRHLDDVYFDGRHLGDVYFDGRHLGDFVRPTGNGGIPLAQFDKNAIVATKAGPVLHPSLYDFRSPVYPKLPQIIVTDGTTAWVPGVAPRSSLGRVVGQADAINPGTLADDLAGTFSGGRYSEVILDADTVLYRAGAADRPLGQFLDAVAPKGIVQARVDKAILPLWPGGGTSPIDSVIAVKVPKGTRVYVGEVSTQGGFYVGGTQQVVVVKPWTIEGVKVISIIPLK